MRASSVLLDHNAAGQVRKIYTYLYIVNQSTAVGAADSMSGSPGNMHSGPPQARTGSRATGSKDRMAGSGRKAAGRRARGQLIALGGVRPARTASIPSNARKP